MKIGKTKTLDISKNMNNSSGFGINPQIFLSNTYLVMGH